jgi:hypothetical protein
MSEPAARCENCQSALDPKEAMKWFRKKYADGDRDPFASDDKFLCPNCYGKLGEPDKASWVPMSEGL